MLTPYYMEAAQRFSAEKVFHMCKRRRSENEILVMSA